MMCPLDGTRHGFEQGEAVELNAKGRRLMKKKIRTGIVVAKKIRTGIVVARNAFYIKVAFDQEDDIKGTVPGKECDWYNPTWFVSLKQSVRR